MSRLGGTSARLMFNYFGDRIADVGAQGLPDIFEAGRGTLDLALTQRFRQFNVRFSLDNATDAEVEYAQGPELQRAYKYGRIFMFQVGYSAF